MNRRGISSELVISILLIVAVVLGSSTGAYLFLLTRNFKRSVYDEITAGKEALRLKITERTRRATLIARFAAADSDLRKLATLSYDNPRATIDFNLIMTRIKDIEPDADIITLIDDDGIILAQTETKEPMASAYKSKKGEPLFLNPLFMTAQDGKSSSGIELCKPDVICIDAIEPIRKAPSPKRLISSISCIKEDLESCKIVGYVRIGFIINDSFAKEVKLATGTDMILMRRERGIAVSLPGNKFTPENAIKLSDSIAAAQANPQRNPSVPPSLRIAGTPYTLDVREINDAGGRQIATQVIARDTTNVENARREALNALAAISFVGFCLSIALSVFSVRRISKPLGSLLSRVHEITNGNLNVQIPVERNDEIGTLANAFNEMTKSISERDHKLRESAAELQHNQEQLIQSGKLAAIGELAAGIAHEIGNPLSAISGYAQMIQQPVHTIDAKIEFSKEIEREADFIEKIIHDLLEFSRPSEKFMEFENPVELAEAALKTVSAHKAFNNIKVEKSMAANIPPVPCYRKEIQQVFMNLLMNAAQAMPKGGVIKLEGSLRGNAVQFRVKDNGPGVPNEIRDKIFNPFFTTKPPGVGTGLGLAITYRIIEKHGGILKLEDSLIGASFLFTLPVKGTQKENNTQSNMSRA